MEKFKFTVFLIVVLVVVGLLGYWAFNSIEPGDAHVSKQKLTALENENSELKEEIAKLQSTIETLQPTPQPEPAPQEPVEKPVEKPTTTTSKYQSLINDLQKLINDKVVMKEKSRGTRVGTVQTFLNIYNNTSKKVDNDFGKTTTTDLIAFQKAVGLKADGEAGATTFQKMIDWLKKQ